MSVPAALALLLWITTLVVNAVANHRRMTSWAKAWETIGPRWSSFR